MLQLKTILHPTDFSAAARIGDPPRLLAAPVCQLVAICLEADPEV
jgi:hypothetical protein